MTFLQNERVGDCEEGREAQAEELPVLIVGLRLTRRAHRVRLLGEDMARQTLPKRMARRFIGKNQDSFHAVKVNGLLTIRKG